MTGCENYGAAITPITFSKTVFNFRKSIGFIDQPLHVKYNIGHQGRFGLILEAVVAATVASESS